MDLLAQITRTALDPDYAARASQGGERQRLPWAAGLVALLAGSMFALAGVQTSRQAPQAAIEREQLENHIQAATATNAGLRAQLSQLQRDVQALQSTIAGSSRTESAPTAWQIASGAVAVKGPGLVVTVDDAPDAQVGDGQVLALDLAQLTNGLWEAGAEAISINDHRLTVRTAIRVAGSAITVDYVSLTRPYRVAAIGSPGLAAAFAGSEGGRWWAYLHANYGVEMQIATSKQLTLLAEPGLGLQVASKEG